MFCRGLQTIEDLVPLVFGTEVTSPTMAHNAIVYFRGSRLLVLKYFYFFDLNAHCALVVVLSEKASTMKYGYSKYGTHAPVFSKTLAHGNKNEIRTEACAWKEVKRALNKEVTTAYHYLNKIQ